MEIVKKEIGFNGMNLIGISFKEKLYVIIKNFCEVLGVDHNSQLKRIKRDEILNKGVVKMTIPSEGGIQETNLLELDYVPLWLAGIKTNQCKEEVRKFLLEFKLKVKDVLSDAFFGKREILQEEKRYNPDLNLIEDRAGILREIENEKRNLIFKQIYIYTRIEYTAKSMVEKLKKEYKRSLESEIFYNGKIMTTEEVDAVDILLRNQIKNELEK